MSLSATGGEPDQWGGDICSSSSSEDNWGGGIGCVFHLSGGNSTITIIKEDQRREVTDGSNPGASKGVGRRWECHRDLATYVDPQKNAVTHHFTLFWILLYSEDGKLKLTSSLESLRDMWHKPLGCSN